MSRYPWLADQRRAAITDRLGLSRRPHPARSLREHGRQRCMLCPQGGQLHGRSVLLADQQYKQLFPYSLRDPRLAVPAAFLITVPSCRETSRSPPIVWPNQPV